MADNVSLAREFYEAINRRDLEHIEALASPDVKELNIATGQVFRGPQGVKESLGGFCSAFPDLTLEVTNLFGVGDQVAAELILRGTQQGELRTPRGILPPTGRRVSLRLCEVTQWWSDHLISVRLYFDTGTMMQQLGLAPSAKGA